jgi:AcrR family transcriptional regulator
VGVTERRAREKLELRASILEAATELFVKEGYQSVSIRRIAERIEYAPSTIYVYFKDKTDLIRSICNETFAQLAPLLEEINQDPSSSDLDRLRRSLRCYVDFGVFHPSQYVAAFCMPRPEVLGCHDHSGERLERGSDALRSLRTAIARCMATGAIAQADLELTTQAAWAMVHGLTSGLISGAVSPPGDQDALIESTLDLIVRAVRAG